LHEDYFHGCLLGGAVGDALGAPIEFLSTAEIRERFGVNGLTDYVHSAEYGRFGAITDDTQMTMFTAEGMLRVYHRWQNRGLCDMPAVLHGAYLRWLLTQGENSSNPDWPSLNSGWLVRVPELHSRRAPGSTCLSALRDGKIGRVEAPLNNSKGCGGIMRVAPVGLLYSTMPNVDAVRVFDAGCDVAAVTHGHPTGYLAAGVFSVLVYRIMRGDDLLQAIDDALALLRNRSGHEETSNAVRNALALAEAYPETSSEVVEQLGRGWVAEEALAIAIYCSLTAQNDFKCGVLAAVNHSGDSDSTGAITGNILGALLGVAAIPQIWLDQLELRAPLEILASDLLIGYSEEPAWENSYPPT